MEQSIEKFREGLITQNPDVTATQEVTMTSAIEDAYRALDILTDILLVEMEDASCIHCAKMYASTFGEMMLAFNAVSKLKESNEIANETNE